MATNVKKQPKKDWGLLIPEKYRDILYVLLLLVSLFVFFSSGIFGGSLLSDDAMASKCFLPFYDQAAKSGVYPLWLPYVFGGMPGFSSFLLNADRVWDITAMAFFKVTEFVGLFFANDSARVVSYYFFFSIGMYFLAKMKLNNRFIAFFVAFAATFSTSIIVWAMIGHNTKPIAFGMLPLIFIFLEKLRKKFSLTNFALLIIVVHILFISNHVQMIFYVLLALGIYIAFEFVSRLITKRNAMSVLRAAGLLVIAGALSFALTADKYLSVLEYTPYSTRGSAPIAKSDLAGTDQTGGNDYEYATGWSYSPSEIMDFFVPNFHGFGQLEYGEPSINGEKNKVLSYWGQKPFEDVAAYMGIFVLFFAIFGFITNKRDIFVQFLAFLSLFALFLSFGNNLPWLYDIFYKYVPSFNKFRAPSMVLVLMQFAVPILSGYGLKSLMDLREGAKNANHKTLKWLMISSFSFLGLALLYTMLFKGSYMSAMAASKNSYFQQQLGSVPDLLDFVYGKMISDWFIGGVLLVCASGTVWLYVKKKIQQPALYGLLLLLLVFDLWRVDWRRLEVHENKKVEDIFIKTDYVSFLQQDKGLFRILDVTNQRPNEPAYFGLQSVGGYSAAKMRTWQDLSDVCDQGSTSYITNPFVLNLFNVKYYVTPQQIAPTFAFQSQQKAAFVTENPGRMPRATFIGGYQQAKPMEILRHLKAGDFNPRKLAYLEKSIKTPIDTPTVDCKVKITNYQNQFIRMEANATGNNLLLVSEMYYPMWHASIDGVETETYKANYAFRAIVVPKGKHTIEFNYIDKAFGAGRWVSLAGNILVLVMLAGGLVLDFFRRKKVNAEVK
ncbi:MAG: YfhO family protein [bacterium]